MKSKKIIALAKGVWAFCSYLFIPQRRPKIKPILEFWYMEVPSCTEWALNTAMMTRVVSNLELRLAEVARLGFTRCIIPRHGTEKLTVPKGLQLLRVRNLREAVEIALG